MIFAAGLGTRLAPLTNDRPKALVKLNGKTLLMRVSEKLKAENFKDITVNVHHFAAMMKEYIQTGEYAEFLKQENMTVVISDESDLLLDTGGALKKAAPKLFAKDDSPVLIHNVDIVSNARLNELYQSMNDADAVLLVSQRETTRYLLFDDDMRLVGWTNIQTSEVRTPFANLDISNCKLRAFSGIHVVSKRLTDNMESWPDKFGITDFYIQSCQNLNIRGVEQPDLLLTDIGKIDVLRKAQWDLTI